MKNNKESQDAVQMAADSGNALLKNVQQFNWFLLIILIGGSWYVFSWTLAQSVLIGGILANASFYMLRRDITGFMTTFSQAGLNWQAVKKLEKVKFFLKFYGRLAVLAVILYLLITQVTIDIVGLVIGLSTIMFSVIVVVLSKGSMLLSTQRFKGA